MDFLDAYKRWVCPSDRELTLRAKLRAGWSSRTQADNAPTTGATINEAEQALITQVLERANRLDEMETERVRRLNERLDKIRSQACGDGKGSCILCNDQPRFFGKFRTCKDCHSCVCSKCSVYTTELGTETVVWLCKICSESREVLKKTNMWTQMCNQPPTSQQRALD